MKTLFIIRHAKSSWDDPDQSDFDRPLNERGKRNAPSMGKRLKDKGIHPDIMITSPAKRTWATGTRIAEILNYSKDKIKTFKALYHADEEVILETVRNMNDRCQVVMLIGHNPGLTDFVNTVADDAWYIDNLPTCAVVGFSFNEESWRNIKWGTGKLVLFDYPKNKEE